MTEGVAKGRTGSAGYSASTSSSSSHSHLDHHHHQNATAGVLNFADVSSDLFLLTPPVEVDTAHNHSKTSPTPASSNNHNLNFSQTSHLAAVSPSPSPTATPIIQPRKPSPGLAARLKALGFGTSRKASSSPPPPPAHVERVGRLPEDQLRLLDQNHQASSSKSIIERRGRPWKGLHTAVTSKSASATAQAVTAVAGGEPGDYEPTSANASASPLLPEIAASEPLDMDTHKYRLPDHTNGNGTKVQLGTRREHIERSVRIQSPEMSPPPPLPKDSPPPTPAAAEFVPDLASYFTPGHQRPGSIYTLSRASFANQLAQLTSLQLPDAESLSSKVSAIPTAQAASNALINAAEQIRSWISKASEVIGGLDSDDDVEWAAAGGREGLEEVENAITRFEELINVYVSAIEGLQRREDIESVPTDDLRRAVSQMESIIDEWTKIRATLQTVKEQVEIAMEWEELWNMVLGDIQNAMDELGRLVFEMEELRHKSLMAVASGEGLDIGDLETIVEETPPHATRLHAQNRFSLPGFPLSPSSPVPPPLAHDDSNLLALFARMQPLRASLDFLPMRLSVFETRAERSFPTACEELEMRRSGLDANYRKLEKDAESLRKELGEDRWVLVFRNAGRQAQKMYESVERALVRLKEGVDAGMHLTSAPTLSKKIESYDAKKTHYGPAIERVLAIIDKGVKDRLTVNGEVLRLHAEMESKWESLKEQMREMDAALEEIQSDKRGQQLRDSISSMLSNDRSTIGSGRDTPGSSPPSSVIMTTLGFDPSTPTGKLAKHRSASVSSHLPQPANRRHSSMPTPVSQLPRKPMTSRLSTLGSTSGIATPTANQIPRPGSVVGHRPKWNGSVNAQDVGTGHNFKPLSLTSPSPYAKRTPTNMRSMSNLTPTSSGGAGGSKLPTLRSPLTRASSASPMPEDTPTRTAGSRLSFRDRINTPGPYSQQGLARPRVASQSSMPTPADRRASFQPPRPQQTAEENRPSRPASSLASTRRVSMLPQPRTKNVTGRESPQAVAGARVAMRKNSSSESSVSANNKPRWRG